MSQQEVYTFLKNNPNEWFTSKDISKSSGISIGSVTTSLKKLRTRGEVGYKLNENFYGRNCYKYKFKK